MPVPELIEHCKKIGIQGIEGVPREFYPQILEAGLEITLVRAHKFHDGPTDRSRHSDILQGIREAIDVAVEVGCERVIMFSGFEVEGLSHEEMTKNCIDCWKAAAPYAEEKGIMLVVEQLNTRDDSHPMRGHPGYFADDIDHCFEMIKAVDSPNVKVLFDIYHVSVMNGDIIRRLRQNYSLIGHIHTAGNPGRAEIGDNQEINYPAILQAIAELGYDDWIAHEFIPESEDKIQSLQEAYDICDF